MGSNNAAARVQLNSQFSMLADKVNVVIASLRSQCDADRRRIAQLERKVEMQQDDKGGSTDGNGREKWAETQGKVNGLEEETQSLSRRIDKSLEQLDKRIWDRTSSSEVKCRSLEQQLQALEQQTKHVSTTTEEVQKRQAAKLRRTEHAVEELTRRLNKAEEERLSSHGPQQGYVEQRFSIVEQNQEQLSLDIQALQEQIDDGLAALGDNYADQDGGTGEATHSLASLEEAVLAAERNLMSLDKKLSPQIEDLAASLASLKVKADGQFHRVASLTDRLETAHVPALESMRAEMAQARAQEKREQSGELAVIRSRVQEVADAGEEATSELREKLRQARAEVAAISLRPEDNPLLRTLEETLGGHENELIDLRARLDVIPGAGEPFENADGEDTLRQPGGLNVMPAIDDVRRRLEWLEEQSTASAAVDQKTESRGLSQVQNTVCDLVEQVSNLKQRTASGEATTNGIQQQVQQLQGHLDNRSSMDSAPARDVSQLDAKVSAVSQQVADIAARLLEVEGDREFARENETNPGLEMSAVSIASEVASSAPGRGLPPLPKGEVERDRGDVAARAELQRQLEAVASQLEALDDLTERVADLEQKNVGSIAGGEQVSFGPTGQVGGLSSPSSGALSKEVASLTQDVTAIRDRLASAEQALQKMPQEDLSLKIKVATDSADKVRTEVADVNQLYEKLSGRVDSMEAAKKTDAGATALQDTVEALKTDIEAIKKDQKSGATAAPETSESVGKLEKELATLKKEHKDTSETSQHCKETVASLVLGNEKLNGRITEMESVVKALGRDSPKSSASSSPKAAQKDILELRNSVQSLAERLDALPVPETGVKEEIAQTTLILSDKLNQLEKDSQSSRAKSTDMDSKFSTLQAEQTKLSTSLKDAQAATEKHSQSLTQVDKRLTSETESLSQRLEAIEPVTTKLDELRSQVSEASTKASEASSAVQNLRDERLDSRAPTSPAASSTAPSAADEKARAEVQSQVEELKRQVMEELGGLTSHQAELAQAKQSLKALSEKVGTAAKPASDSQQQEDAEARKRLKVLEDSLGNVQKDIKELQFKAKGAEIGEIRNQLAELSKKVNSGSPTGTPVRKVGIGIGGSSGEEPGSSPIAFVRNKLDLLSEQVADLQCKVASGSNSGSATGAGASGLKSGEQSKENSFNFSITEAADQTGDRCAGSLNFSMTEPKPGGSRGNSRGNSPLSSPRSVSDGDTSPKRKDAPSVGIGGRGKKEEKKQEVDTDELDDLLDDIAGDSDSKKKPKDAVDSLLGKAAGSYTPDGRPRPPALDFEDQSCSKTLPSVVEEESADLNDSSKKMSASGGSPPASSKSGSGGAVAKAGTTKSVTPKSTKSSRSVESPTGGERLEISMSVNDVSIGCDISVEDSLQLEDECDHVEAVKPNPKLRDTMAAASAAAAASSTSPDAAAGEKAKAPTDALEALMGSSRPSPTMKLAPLTATVGLGGAASSTSPKYSKTSPKSASQSKNDDENYDESFDEDDMSVPESIDESVDKSGSDAWGGDA